MHFPFCVLGESFIVAFAILNRKVFYCILYWFINRRPYRLMVRTAPSHGVNRGSNPRRVTKKKTPREVSGALNPRSGLMVAHIERRRPHGNRDASDIQLDQYACNGYIGAGDNTATFEIAMFELGSTAE